MDNLVTRMIFVSFQGIMSFILEDAYFTSQEIEQIIDERVEAMDKLIPHLNKTQIKDKFDVQTVDFYHKERSSIVSQR